MNSKSSTRFVLLIAATACLLFVIGMPLAWSRTISVQDTAWVHENTILLGDIATIYGDLDFITRMETVPIGRAPFPGKERVLSKGHIVARLKHNDVDVKSVHLTCPKKIRVISDFREYSQNDIEMPLRTFIIDAMPWRADQVQISDILYKPVRLPNKDYTLRFKTKKGEDFLGRFNATLGFYTREGSLAKKTDVSAHIVVVAPVVVNLGQLERHSIITAEDLRVVQKDITYITKNAVKRPEEIIGSRTKKRISPNTLLRKDMFCKAPIVKKGDMVTLFFEDDFITITAPGIVLEDGALGDLIKVNNVTSQKKIYGFVHEEKRVQVKY